MICDSNSHIGDKESRIAGLETFSFSLVWTNRWYHKLEVQGLSGLRLLLGGPPLNYFGFVTMALYVHLTKFVSNQMNWRTDVQGGSRSWMHGVTDNSIDLNYMENSRFVLLPLNVFQIWQFHSSHDSYSTTSRPKKCLNAKIHAPKFCKNLQKRVTCPGIPCIVPTCLRPVWAVRFELKSLELYSLLVCQLSTLRVFTSLLFRSQITVRLTLQVLCPNCAPNYKYWGNPDR